MKQYKYYLGLLLIALILWLLPAKSQNKKLFTKQDIAPMTLCFVAGNVKGWKDEAEYHPNAFFRKFPNLNRNFWDIRVQDKPGFLNTEWDFNHVSAGVYKGLFVSAIVVRMGEKQKWYWYIWDGFKYLAAHSVGFYTSYNLLFKNKL